MSETEYTFQVFRGDANGGEEREYKVPAVPGMVVLDAIHWIQAHLAGDLAVRWNCKAAKCGSCSAEINGVPKLMCKTRLDDFKGVDVHVAPMHTFPIIKDLVTDVSWNYAVNKRIAPFTPREDEPSPFIMYQEDVDRLYEPRKCIECFLCQDVCHVLRNHGEMSEYFGPRFMVRYQYLAMHPKDSLDRREAIKDKGGIGLCNITKCCQEVCPEHIHITDNSIIPLKERVADEFFDPVRWFIRRRGDPANAKPKEDLDGSGVEPRSQRREPRELPGGKDIAAS
jgi:succinate dehydrogenase / fumarate reductase, iron-sulfur subunit